MRTTERLLEMIHLLGGGRVWSVREFAERFDVSDRTVFRDLGRLEDSRVPIIREDGGYRLIADARLRPLNLDHQERAMLALSLKNPSLRANDLHARRADLVAAKLSAVSHGEGGGHSALGGPERSGPVARAVIETIETAIDDGRSIEMLYVSLSSGARHRVVEPWKLIHRDGAWYLAARCREHGDLRFFRLDRIESATRGEVVADRPDDQQLDKALSRSWSIYQGDALFEIVIRVDPEIAPLIEHARHHAGETCESLESGELEYRVQLAHLDEIARWILGFGGRARAIAPEQLRERVRELAKGALEVHTKRRGPKRADKSDKSDVGQVRQVRHVRRQTGPTK